jgi:hypothetical protein
MQTSARVYLLSVSCELGSKSRNYNGPDGSIEEEPIQGKTNTTNRLRDDPGAWFSIVRAEEDFTTEDTVDTASKATLRVLRALRG